MCVPNHHRTSKNLLTLLRKLTFGMQGGTQKPDFIYQKLCVYSYTVKLQSPSEYSPFDAIHPSRRFFHRPKQFMNALILIPFSASVIFWFHFFHISESPFEDFFHWENKKKPSCSGWDQMNGGGRAILGVMPYLVKDCWTRSMVWQEHS